MINGLEGIPGSGKSYEAVTFHVLHALKTGRLVITNLPLQKLKFAEIDESYYSLIELRHKPAPILGTWDVDRVDDKGKGLAFQLHDSRSTVEAFDEKPKEDNGVFGTVWDFYSTWKHPVTGEGPLYVIDECHICFPKVGINPEVVEWFKLHRHFNCDVLLATQNFRDVNQPIAQLLAMMVKVRNADILTGKRDSYIRKVHAGYRGAPISTEVRKYEPQYFALYKSHSQGNSVSESAASDVKPMLAKFKSFSKLFYIVTAIYCVWAAYNWTRSKPIIPTQLVTTKPTEPVSLTSQPVAQVPASLQSASTATVSQNSTLPDAQKMQAMATTEVPEPYASKGMHLTGRMELGKRVMYTFALSNSNIRIGQVTSDDLKKIGYVWEPLTDCSGTLRWKTTAKTVTCDAPATTEGSSSSPVVITVPAGAVNATARSDGLPVNAEMSKPRGTT